jgi:hypothetical protein
VKKKHRAGLNEAQLRGLALELVLECALMNGEDDAIEAALKWAGVNRKHVEADVQAAREFDAMKPAEKKVLVRWTAKPGEKVPAFVRDATGLSTVKDVIARWGEGATFELGKPLPKPSAPSPANAKPTGTAAKLAKKKPAKK